MVALNETLGGVVERELVELEAAVEAWVPADGEIAGGLLEVEEPTPARAAFVDESALFETADLPAGNRREQLVIQIRLMNPGATREMLVGFSEGALQAYVDHLKLAMTPRELIRGRGRGVRMSGVPGIVRHVPDSE